MGKAGIKAKKRRARVHTPVKMKKKKLVNMEKSIRDPVLKEQWDNKKTVKQNLDSISMKVYEDALPQEKDLRDKWRTEKIGDRDYRIMEKLTKMHGRDLKAMSRNIRVNVWQWTEAQLRKKLELFDAAKDKPREEPDFVWVHKDNQRPLMLPNVLKQERAEKEKAKRGGGKKKEEVEESMDQEAEEEEDEDEVEEEGEEDEDTKEVSCGWRARRNAKGRQNKKAAREKYRNAPIKKF
uniref:Nucleolar protein 16 n=1 Tax=Chromera velia CCMP2878 TaxID=1169474 RepID=A0A0G4HZ49_9ALVE|mmetsp:Transcript_5863/g.11643  ORF Transcript_5863/g.11643 Transcript_5863/m.11643 type:complete len:237 (+) Transcript_5863:104-814(+)|eukprot:Cvel_33791.t1-p1 / transcript=Cvel_33791.t1 / gene=Cvel_33791 / organism=Chromera_velia_CCMP2878 / gene_product=hypothetical protein / transcript_product=hypothetical protein / location=Cvel_scaffold5596:1917-4114(+) / protein_length=236 / sequence_SO=supercontig / SO=protein_coding / is_pseudo=false